MDDFEFNYMGESADQDDLNEDFEHDMDKESKFQHS